LTRRGEKKKSFISKEVYRYSKGLRGPSLNVRGGHTIHVKKSVQFISKKSIMKRERYKQRGKCVLLADLGGGREVPGKWSYYREKMPMGSDREGTESVWKIREVLLLRSRKLDGRFSGGT